MRIGSIGSIGEAGRAIIIGFRHLWHSALGQWDDDWSAT